MRVVICKAGNGLVIRIPRALAVLAQIGAGTVVDLSLEASRLVVSVVPEPKTLDDLLAEITTKNRHAESLSGMPSGNETW